MVALILELILVSLSRFSLHPEFITENHVMYTDKDGPIHDVTWNPNSKEFGVVYGYMPAKTTIFNVRGSAKHSFALGPRNTILFSPHGRFVLVAGFGNLAGQMDIYDMDKNYHKVATVEAANSSVCEWSPDGKHILTATTSPRLRVDNGIRIWHVSGSLMYNEDMHELYQVCWRPQSTTQHPLPENPFNPLPTPHPSALAYLSTRKVPQKSAGAYRPPGARGQGTPLAFKREDEGGTALASNGPSFSGNANGPGRPRRREVPGAEPAEYIPPGAAPGGGVALPPGLDQPDKAGSKSASKNKKKREAKKQKDSDEKNGEESTANLPPPTAPKKPSRSPDPRGPKKGGQNQNQNSNGNTQKNGIVNGSGAGATAQPPSGAPTTTTANDAKNTNTGGAEGGDATGGDKKIRGLLKKMRAIDDLKMRLASGEKLEDTQMKKILSEDAVRKDLEASGYN